MAVQFGRRCAVARGREWGAGGQFVTAVCGMLLASLWLMATCSVEEIGDHRVYLESVSSSLQGRLSFENTSTVVKDWGHLRRYQAPAAVVYPTGVEDVATIVQAVASRADSELTVAARGLGHSINGQAQVRSITNSSLTVAINRLQ